MSKFKVGDKVVPLKKTAGVIGLDWSAVWKEALHRGQKFLYVNRVSNNEYLLDINLLSNNGDYFSEDDLILYCDDSEKHYKVSERKMNPTCANPIGKRVPDKMGNHLCHAPRNFTFTIKWRGI